MTDDESNNAQSWFSIAPLHSPLDSPPPSVDVKVDFGAWTARGPLRPVNDDHYLVLRLGRHQETLMTSLPNRDVGPRFDEFGYGMVVADGLGHGGETASRLAISTLVHLAIYFGRWHVRIDEPIAEEVMDRAQRFYRSVDGALRQASQQHPSGLQTTMTAVLTAGPDLFFVHVGHSRAYLFRDDRLMQLTRDHTVEQGRPARPTIVDAAANTRDRHHIVTQTLGGPGQTGSHVDIERFGLLDDDLILLCTNGLTDVVTDPEIADVLRSSDTPDDLCRSLADRAIAGGGKDDVTVVAARYRISNKAPSSGGK